MYGDGRVELYPPLDYPERHSGVRRTPPVEGFQRFDQSKSTDLSLRRQWNEDLKKDTATEYREAVETGPLPYNTPTDSLAAPMQPDGSRGGVHPLRSAAVQTGPLSGGSSQQTGGAVRSPASITIQTADEPSAGGVPSGQGPGDSSAFGQGPGSQAWLPESGPPSGPAAGAKRVAATGNDPRDDRGRDPSSDWLATGIVQVIGTLIGLFIGLAVCVLALPFFFRRFGDGKLRPIIRVEIANTPLLADSAGRLGANAEIQENRPPPADAPVPVVDFREQSVQLRPPGGTYDQQQQAKAEQRKRQEKEIMRQILDKNVALREELSGLLPAA